MRILFFSFFFIISFPSFAQNPLYTHQQWFKVEDGLPQGFVSEIIQDDDGFLWISTLDGLARYDGRGFRIFQQESGDSTSISSNVISEMVQSRDKKLWLFYQGQQLDVFNPSTLQRTARKLSPLIAFTIRPELRIAEYNGKFWSFITKDGLAWMNIFNFETGTASIKNGLLKDNEILASAYHPDGRVWLLSKKCIQVSDSMRHQFSYVPLQQPLPTDFHISKYTQWEIFGEEMVVISSEHLWFINYKNGNVRKYPLPSVNDFDAEFRKLRKGLDGKLYARSFKGVYRVNDDGSMILLWKNTILPERNITAFMVDRSGVLWVGLDAGGLVKINLRSMPLNSYNYKYNFHADLMMHLGIRLNQIPELWKTTNYSYEFRYAYGLDSTLYLTYNRLHKEDFHILGYRDGKLFKLPFPPDLETAYIRGISIDKQGKIWALDEWNRAIWCWRDNQSLPDRYPTSLIYAQVDPLAYLYVAGNDQWITTHGHGMYRLNNGKTIDHNDKTTKPNDVPYDLTEICPDPVNPDRLWIGSRGGGLILWDIHKKLQRTFTRVDGLPNNTIYCVVPDKFGKLWLSTNKGICRFDPVTYEVHNFEKNDGLPGNEFNRAHEFRFADGRIMLGGLDGYVIFQPLDFSQRKDTLPLRIQLTEILVNNHSLKFGEKNSVLLSPLAKLDELTLPYYKNYLNISFAALQYNEPQKIRYRYRLKGLSDDWVESGLNNTAHYTQLAPGNYVLEINATTLEGTWSKDVRRLALHILPPIWKTWWAYAIYLMAAITTILYFLKYRERRLKAQQELIFEQKETERLRELDEVKSRFFSNITHEFRTPLTLVTAPLEKLSRDPAMPAPLLQTVHTIQRNANKLLGLINQLLDLSKLEAGQMMIHYSAGDLSVFVDECVQSFTNAASEKNIGLFFSSESTEGLFLFDEEKWERIITNIVSNALKFTPDGGEVKVTLSVPSDNKIKLSVQDSGPGIPHEQQQLIFDRFYQADTSSTRRYEGTGIGLSLVKELTRLMGGTVDVQNTIGKGALFTVILPIERPEGSVGNIISSPILPDTEMVVESAGEAREKHVVLLVEDNDEMRDFIAESLAARWTIIQAKDGQMASEMIGIEMPDIVVSDVMMPRKDGFELCRETKADPRTAHIGFILLTAKTGHSNKVEGLGTGAVDYIIKPFHFDELELRIQNLLQLQDRMRIHLQSQLLPSSLIEAPVIVVNPFLKELYQILDEHLDDPQLGVEKLASQLNMSKSTLNRKLRSLLDLSAVDLIRRYRLQKAIQMLKEGIDISTVAYQSGFSSPSYFSQCFKEQYGVSPSGIGPEVRKSGSPKEEK